jgi:hypothetical protein
MGVEGEKVLGKLREHDVIEQNGPEHESLYVHVGR